MSINGVFHKAFAASTAGAFVAVLALAPASAHKVKQNADSNTLSVGVTVADECKLQQGGSVTLPEYFPVSGQANPVTVQIGYYCTNGGSPSLISFQTGYPWGIPDCSAVDSDGSQNYLFYKITVAGSQVNCAPGQGGSPGVETGFTPGQGPGQEEYLAAIFQVDTNYVPFSWQSSGYNQVDPPGTYRDYLTVGITP
jgi:hypothetical protein